jgi:SAM-dependent methyltransferase
MSSKPFETDAERYDSWYERYRPAYESELAAIRELLPAAGRGVEVGVGTGRFAQPLGIGTGVEPSRAMARLARRRGVELLIGYAEKLPWEEASFDYVLMVTTLCFLDDPVAALAEIHRVLRPGGHLLIGFIDRTTPLGREYQRRKEEEGPFRYARLRSPNEVLELLRQARFADPEFRQTLFRLPAEMREPDPVEKGHGDGGFVVLRVTKEIPD